MRNDAQNLEDGRLVGFDIDSYPWYHERHRIFPQIFEKGKYKKIIDISAGIGIVARQINENYDAMMVANDIASESLKSLRNLNLTTTSFDLDDPDLSFPFPDETFDAVITLATLEHIIQLDHHMQEINRILKKGGHLFLSVPNYTGVHFVVPFVLKGKTFHDFTKSELDKYEFYAHVRYFTYNSLIDFVTPFGFVPEKSFLPLPHSSTKFRALEKRSKLKAFIFKTAVHIFYKVMHPRWAFHPVLQFRKDVVPNAASIKPKKIIL